MLVLVRRVLQRLAFQAEPLKQQTRVRVGIWTRAAFTVLSRLRRSKNFLALRSYTRPSWTTDNNCAAKTPAMRHAGIGRMCFCSANQVAGNSGSGGGGVGGEQRALDCSPAATQLS